MQHSVSSRSARHGRLPKRRLQSTLIRGIALAVAVVVVSVGSVAAFAVEDTLNSAHHSIHLTDASGHAITAAAVGAHSGAVNILLAGTDTRTGQGGQFDTSAELAGSSGAGNNDVTMVLHLSADHKHATVISIPRDLMVPVPACPTSNGETSPESSAQFNSTLSLGGLSCVVLTAEQLLGITIPYAAEISFDGVVAMSDAIGGVPVCLATAVNDPYVGLNLSAGEHTLVGAQALAFVRSRHGVGDGSDLGRISDQQQFLSSLLRTSTSAGVLSNPVTLYSLAKAAVSNIELTDTLDSPTTLVSIALALKNVPLSQFVFLQYPAETDPTNPNRVIPDPSGVAVLQQALATDTPVTLTGGTGVATETVTPSASATPSTAASASASASSATPTPTATSTAVALPSNVTGQTAAQQTCTLGFGTD